MKVELRALDPVRKRAIVQAAECLYSVSEERAWRPVAVGKDDGSSSLFTPSVISVRQWYETLEELIEAVQEVLSKGLTSSDSVRRCLSTKSNRAREQDESPWTRDFPNLIRMFHGLLDYLFTGRGCSAADSLRLAVETFDRLHKTGPVETQDVPLVLYEIASLVYAESFGTRTGTPLETTPRAAPARLGEALEARRIRRILQELNRPALQCLWLWADSSCDEATIAALLKFPVDKVTIWLELVASKLGCSREQLRDLRILEVVREFLTAVSD